MLTAIFESNVCTTMANSSMDIDIKVECYNSNCQAVYKNGRLCTHPFKLSYKDKLLCKVHYNSMLKAEKKEEVCAICLDNMKTGTLMTLGCNHRFHQHCLTTWCNQDKDTCPMCRAPMSTECLVKLNRDVLNHLGNIIYGLSREQRRVLMYNIDRTIVHSVSSFYAQQQPPAATVPIEIPVPVAVPVPTATDDSFITPGPQVAPVIQVYEDRERYVPRDPRLRPRNTAINYDIYPMVPLGDPDEE